MTTPPNFGDLPEDYAREEKAKIVILPVPYDGTSTWGKGADKGPAAIIEASANMAPLLSNGRKAKLVA